MAIRYDTAPGAGVVGNKQPVVKNISAAGDGSVWAVDRRGAILLNTQGSRPWTPVPGVAADIAVAARVPAVYALRGTAAYVHADAGWTPVPAAGVPLKAIALGTGIVPGQSDLWAIGTDQGVRRLSLPAGTWTDCEVTADVIAPTSDGAVYRLDRGVLYRQAGDGTWQYVEAPESLASVSAGTMGWVWAVGVSGIVHQYDGEEGWNAIPPPVQGPPGAISCGDDTTVWLLASGTIYAYDPSVPGWDEVPWTGSGSPARVDIADRALAWAVGSDNAIYRYTELADSWQPIAGDSLPAFGQVSAVDRTALWVLDAASAARSVRSQDDRWRAGPAERELAWVSAAPDGSVWGVGSAGEAYQRTGRGWQQRSTAPALTRISVASAGEIAAADADGGVYRWDDATAWTPLPAPAEPVRDLSMIPGGAIWAITDSGALVVYLGRWVGYAGTDLTAVTATSSGLIWAIDRGGRPVEVQHPGAMMEGGPASRGPVPGWYLESVGNERYSTHLWLVNRGATVAGEAGGPYGRTVAGLVKPFTQLGADRFHDQLLQGLYDADEKAPYNDPANGIGPPTWKSHFCHPVTKENYFGETRPTALTQGAEYFRLAVQQHHANDPEHAGYSLGLSLHYLTDLTQPMHTGNFTYWDSFLPGYHTDYEQYVMAIQTRVPIPRPRELIDLGIEPEPYLLGAAGQAYVNYYRELCPSDTIGYRGYLSEKQQQVADATVGPILTDAIMWTAQYLMAWMKAAHVPAWHWSGIGVAQAAQETVAGVGAVAMQENRSGAQWPLAAVVTDEGRLAACTYDGLYGWTWTDVGTPAADVRARGGAGLVTVRFSADNPTLPYAFVSGTDGNLHLAWWNETGISWSDLGSPGRGQQIMGSAGAITIQDAPAAQQRPYVFVLAGDGEHADGRLYLKWWDGAAWHWSDLATPTAAVDAAAGLGAVTVRSWGRQYPQAFVLGSDGHLHMRAFDGTRWAWTDHGVPADGAGLTAGVGAVAVQASYIADSVTYVFVLTGDGQVHVRRGNDVGAGWAWRDLGTPGVPIACGLGALAIESYGSAAQHPCGYVLGDDGAIYGIMLDGGAWQWAKEGTADPDAAGWAGAAAIHFTPIFTHAYPFVFARASTGALLCDSNASTPDWNWVNPGFLTKPVGVARAVGAVVTPGSPVWGEHLTVFVIGDDDRLHSTRWDGQKWTWSDTAATGPLAGGTGAVAVRASSVAQPAPYAFAWTRAGHLGMSWWDGRHWNWNDLGVPAAGITISGGAGTVTVRDARLSRDLPWTFVLGSDGSLRANSPLDAAGWSDLGSPARTALTAGVGAVQDAPVTPQSAHVFAAGSDGHLWQVSWDGKKPDWFDAGAPRSGVRVAGGVGAYTAWHNPTSTRRRHAVVWGDDGHLYRCWFDGQVWTWTDQGVPPAAQVRITGAAGVVAIQDDPANPERAYAFVLASDGHVYLNWFDGQTWAWLDQGLPAQGPKAAGGLAAVALRHEANGPRCPYALVRGDDGGMYGDWWW